MLSRDFPDRPEIDIAIFACLLNKTIRSFVHFIHFIDRLTCAALEAAIFWGPIKHFFLLSPVCAQISQFTLLRWPKQKPTLLRR